MEDSYIRGNLNAPAMQIAVTARGGMKRSFFRRLMTLINSLKVNWAELTRFVASYRLAIGSISKQAFLKQIMCQHYPFHLTVLAGSLRDAPVRRSPVHIQPEYKWRSFVSKLSPGWPVPQRSSNLIRWPYKVLSKCFLKILTLSHGTFVAEDLIYALLLANEYTSQDS